MDRESTQKLRLDRRLIGRRTWISPEELNRELEALPDVSSKATTLGEGADAEREDAEASEGSGAGSPSGA